MKYLSIVALVLLFSISSFSQGSRSIEKMTETDLDRPNYPKHDWQIGSTFSHLIRQQISFDVNYRYFNNQVFGVELSRIELFPQSTESEIEGDEPLIDRTYKGWAFAAYQKLYMSRSSSDNFVYFRHGLRGDFTKHEYYQDDWFEIYKDGNTFLNYEQRYFTDNSFRMGYDAVFGIELYHGRFSTDLFAGAVYYLQMNNNALSSDDIFIPSYTGLRPVFGLRLALNIGPTEYYH